MMKGFVQGADRQQTTLLPECLDDWVDESNPVATSEQFISRAFRNRDQPNQFLHGFVDLIPEQGILCQFAQKLFDWPDFRRR
jgi:hypothetical protein